MKYTVNEVEGVREEVEKVKSWDMETGDDEAQEECCSHRRHHPVLGCVPTMMKATGEGDPGRPRDCSAVWL